MSGVAVALARQAAISWGWYARRMVYAVREVEDQGADGLTFVADLDVDGAYVPHRWRTCGGIVTEVEPIEEDAR